MNQATPHTGSAVLEIQRDSRELTPLLLTGSYAPIYAKRMGKGRLYLKLNQQLKYYMKHKKSREDFVIEIKNVPIALLYNAVVNNTQMPLNAISTWLFMRTMFSEVLRNYKESLPAIAMVIQFTKTEIIQAIEWLEKNGCVEVKNKDLNIHSYTDLKWDTNTNECIDICYEPGKCSLSDMIKEIVFGWMKGAMMDKKMENSKPNIHSKL